MTTLPTIRRAALAALLTTALPLAAGAQTLAYASAAPPPADTDRADELHAEASRLSGETWDLRGAATRRIAAMHEQAAALYAQEDARGVDCLEHAAMLLHRVDAAEAARLQRSAADRALARGDLLTAAHRYIDVASHAVNGVHSGDLEARLWMPEAREMASLARRLAASPELSAEERASIEKRLR